jgi:thioredoxin:protein disulfide reductase
MNRRILVALALAGSTLVAGSAVQAKSNGAWNDVPTGFELAKRTNKPIITDFYTDWCGWCKKMEHSTFENPSVEKVMTDNFVLVRANAEDGGSGERLAHQYKINGYPTIMIFDPSGAPKGKLIGYQEAEPFKATLNKFLGGAEIGSQE